MKKIVVANWKMFLNYEETFNLVNKLNKLCISNYNIDLIISPSNIFLKSVIDHISNHIKICCQNISENDNGAFTGEISGSQIKSIGVKYCIVGHYERRSIYNESYIHINKKIDICLQNDIIPIICISENKKNDKINKILNDIKNEIINVKKNINKIKLPIIAYEPSTSIGTGATAPISLIKIVSNFVREIFKSEMYNKNIKFLYGGSINKDNISSIIKYVDGVIIGKLSASDDIIDILNNFLSIK